MVEKSIYKHLQLVLSPLPRRNWVTADSGAASSRRNGVGVMFPECLYTAQSDGIAPGTFYLLSRPGRAITAACSKTPEPFWYVLDVLWAGCAAGRGSRLAWKRVRATNSSTGGGKHRAAQHGVVVNMWKTEYPVSWDADNLKIGLHCLQD